MINTRFKAAIVLTLLVVGPEAALADKESECHEAKQTYNTVIGNISTALRRYSNCISSSAGHDDCESEFRRLKDEQEDFENAVREIEDNC